MNDCHLVRKSFSGLFCLTQIVLSLLAASEIQAAPSPWAILLCKVRSDATGRFNPDSEPPDAPGVLPFKTVCTNFFTRTDRGFNAVRYFSDMSHGNLDLSGSRIFGWYTINVNITGYTAEGDPILDKTQDQYAALARQAAANAGVAIASFSGVVVILNLPTGAAQGTPGTVWLDWRRVDGRDFDGTLGPRGAGGGNGIEAVGQEMGHGYGLDHSRRDGSSDDYEDPWDIMSTANAYSAADPDYCARGPGLNAWNMRSRGWLDETRVSRGSSGDFSQVIQLRPLHRRDLPGSLAAELPAVGNHSSYLVEFRLKEDWDAAIPRSAVFVHRFEGANNQPLGAHSYIMRGTSGQHDLVAGDVLDSTDAYGQYSRVEVLNIDEVQRIATVRLSHKRSCFAGMPVLSVPSAWSTVRDAYRAASECNIIRIAPGTYPEAPLLFNSSKSVRLESMSGIVTIR